MTKASVLKFMASLQLQCDTICKTALNVFQHASEKRLINIVYVCCVGEFPNLSSRVK